MNRSASYRTEILSGLKATLRNPAVLSIFIFICNVSFSQEAGPFTYFGIHEGFYLESQTLDKCKTYYDSNAHVLFNPCFDFRNKGIYSSYFARRIVLGDCPACDSITVLLPHPVTDLDWKQIQENQKEMWDYYFRLWTKQDKLERYYFDLEGIIRNIKPLKF